MAEAPERVVLRHRDATRQAWMYGAFGALLFGIVGLNFLNGSPGRWWLLVLLAPALMLAYFTLRLATAKVILDERGILEPQALRPTILTPWNDVARVFRTSPPADARFGSYGVGVEHREGWKHQVVALYALARDPMAVTTVDGWLRDIREAKKRWA